MPQIFRFYNTILFLVILNFATNFVLAQVKDSIPLNKNLDTINFQEIKVVGFGTNLKLLETPASIVPLQENNFKKFSEASLVNVINTVPGVDMQERSPGNYRLSIRGSTLRSSFNVRNVKIYWNGIPYTDAGGTSWLTSLDERGIGSIEILKGPTASAYGAGNGGTLLIQSKLPQDSGIHAEINSMVGSFGLRGWNFSLMNLGKVNKSYLNYSILKSDGYRIHSGIDRQMINFRSDMILNSNDQLSISAFYADLHYQTPYSLNASSYANDPKQARPINPSTITLNTGEYVKKLFLGISNHYQWKNWENTSSISLSPDLIRNNSLLNIQKTTEINAGIRNETQYRFSGKNLSGKLALGGEYLYQVQTDRDYGNLKGNPDSIQRDDEITNKQWFAFTRLELNFPNHYFLHLGASFNHISYQYLRLSYKPSRLLGTQFDPILSPRIALLKEFSPHQSLYLSYSYGYSPPASSEVLPSTGIINSSLQAEIAHDLELGYRGNFWNNLLNLDLTLFQNQVQHSIVKRTDSSGQDFYINAGSSVENGIEGLIRFNLIKNNYSTVHGLSLWANITFNNFYFKDYILNGQNLSGNPFTGVSPSLIISGIDTQFKGGFYGNFNFKYSGKVPLNDQNTVKANPYYVFGGKIGLKRSLGKNLRLELNSGVDNIFNKKYSLGNDINATAGRYYNPALIRNYFTSLSLSY